jgi:G3E family GTPase
VVNPTLNSTLKPTSNPTLNKPSGVEIVEVPGGCLCCSAVDEFKGALEELLRRGVQRIFIEATGLANAEQVRSDVAMMGFPVESTFCVVDALNVERLAALFATVGEQIAAADVVLIAKTDLLDHNTRTSALQAVHGLVRSLNSRAVVVYLSQGVLPSDFAATAFAPPQHFVPQEPFEESSKHGSTKHLFDDGITAFRVLVPEPVQAEALEEAFSGLPSAVVRVKGVLQIHGESHSHERHDSYNGADARPAAEWFMVNIVCGRAELLSLQSEWSSSEKPSGEWSSNEWSSNEQWNNKHSPAQAELFIIGKHLSAAAIEQCFAPLQARVEAGTVRYEGLVEHPAHHPAHHHAHHQHGHR